jgi:hypothetical protein
MDGIFLSLENILFKKNKISQAQWLKPVILATQEASPGKKFTRPHLNQWLGVVVHARHPGYSGKRKLENDGPCQPGHKARPLSKN